MFNNWFSGRKIGLLCCVLLIAQTQIIAQNYPVFAQVAFNYPYPVSLKEMGSAGDKYTVTLLHKDFATPEVEVYLQMRLEGTGITIQTVPQFKHNKPILLTAGNAMVIQGGELSYLFESAAWEVMGLDKQSFLSAGTRLPQGLHRFTIQVFEYSTGRAVSNQAVATANLSGHLPPIINLPYDGSEVPVTTPQNVVIQWTPRQSGSQALVGNTLYRVQVAEMIPFNRNPNEVIQSTAIPFIDKTTSASTIIIGAADAQLMPGRFYALCVQAVDVNGENVFENEGYSQVISFVYGNKCPEVTGIAITETGAGYAALTWNADSSFRACEIQYSAAGTWQQHTEMAFSNQIALYGLHPGKTYRAEIRGICSESVGTASAIGFITRMAADSFENWVYTKCGKPLPLINLKNQIPLMNLQAGDIIKAADFEVRVLSASGSGGVFSGNGNVKLPYTGKIPIPCSFNNIRVNTDRRLIGGTINVLRKPFVFSDRTVQNLSENWNEIFGDKWNRFSTQTYGGTIYNVSLNGQGKIIVTGSFGSQTLRFTNNSVVTDNSGNRYFISDGGKVTVAEGPSTQPFVADLKSGNKGPEKLNTGEAHVFFGLPAIAGNDDQNISAHTAGNQYEKLTCADTPYYVGWKLLKAGEADSVVCSLMQGKITSVNLDSVHFARSDGTMLRHVRAGNEYRVFVTGRLNRYTDAIWAYYMKPTGCCDPVRVVLGKLNLINVDRRKVHVRLVPVNGNKISVKEAEDKLNEHLGGNGLLYDVSESHNLSVTGLPEGYKVMVDRAMLGSAYNKDLSLCIQALESRYPWIADYQGNDTAWLFVLPESAGKEQGYMALNRNYGFLFAQNGANWHTIAHETGHGLLNLEHAFHSESEAGFSQNLMDYSTPYALLNVSQWLSVFDPSKTALTSMRLRQDAEKGRMMDVFTLSMEELGLPDTGMIHVVIPDGRIMALRAELLQGLSFSQTLGRTGTYIVSRNAGRANGTVTGIRYNGDYYGVYISNRKVLGYFQDLDFSHIPLFPGELLDEGVNEKVYAGIEDSSCGLNIYTGYHTSHQAEKVVDSLSLQQAQKIKYVDLAYACLEYFDEDQLSEPAKRWWKLAQQNEQFKPNADACRRIVRLIDDLGDDYRYFDLESFRTQFSIKKPAQIPPFEDPAEPFTDSGIRRFENYLRVNYLCLQDLEEALLPIEDAQQLGAVLSTLPDAYLQQLSLRQRMRLLRKLVNAGLSNYYHLYGLLNARASDNETVTLALLSTTPDNQISDLLDSLIYPGKIRETPHLLAALSANIDGFDFKEYYDFADLLFRWLLKFRPPDFGYGLDAAMEESKVFFFNSGLFQNHVYAEYQQNGQLELSLETFLKSPDTKSVTSPYDWVFIKFLDDFEMGTHQFSDGQVLRLPAVYVAAIFEKENSEKWEQTGSIAVDVTLLTMGVGEVRMLLQGGSAARKFWLTTKALADLGSSLGDFLMSAGLGQQLEKSVPGRSFLETWNSIQLYYGIGSIAESGLNGLVKKLYSKSDEVRTLRVLGVQEEKEMDAMLDVVETETGVLRSSKLKGIAGAVQKGRNLMQLEAPVNFFRQLKGNGKTYRAANFWKRETAEMEHYITRDGKFYIKRDPGTGEALFIDVEREAFVGYYLDETGTAFKGNYESFSEALRTIHGLDGGWNSIQVGGMKLEFSKNKINMILGRFDPSDIDKAELGTKHFMEKMELLKNYSFANSQAELAAGAVHVLNIPDELAKFYETKGVEFWDAFNKHFLDIAIQNKDRLEVVLMTDPRKIDMLSVYDKVIKDFTNEPTYFALELKYLLDNGLQKCTLIGGQKIDLESIDFGAIKFE